MPTPSQAPPGQNNATATATANGGSPGAAGADSIATALPTLPTNSLGILGTQGQGQGEQGMQAPISTATGESHTEQLPANAAQANIPSTWKDVHRSFPARHFLHLSTYLLRPTFFTPFAHTFRFSFAIAN